MKDSAGNAMPPFASVELGQSATTLGFVIDARQRMQGFVDAAELCQKALATPLGVKLSYGHAYTGPISRNFS